MKKFKFTINGHEYDVELSKFEENIAQIEVNGTMYEIEVQQEVKQTKTPKLVRSEVPPPKRSDTKIKKTISTSAYQVKAPLPGNVMQVYVKSGDQVKKGDKLMVYEAMKMENDVLAEKDGTVKTIMYQPGDSFLQGEVLIEIG